MAVRWELPLFFAVFVTICGETHHKIRHKREAVEEQPRIVTQNGHLIFQTGANHNISFKSLQGGFVNIDGIDIQTVVKSVENNKDAISVIQGQQKADTDAHFTQVEGRITHLETWKGTHLQDIETISQLQTDMNALKARITIVENEQNRQKAVTMPPVRPTVDLSDIRSSLIHPGESIPQLTENLIRPSNLPNSGAWKRPGKMCAPQELGQNVHSLINALETKVSNLWNKLKSNECQNEPCQNGGTCVDLYNGYICRCPDAWEGKTCNTDVNECARFAGTDLGCQNGATCRNTRGGYSCSCTANWFGVHCASQHDDCARASSQMEICGHGTCHDAKRIEKDKPKYTCSCDEGWTTAGSSPACTIDVDECSLTNPPCSQNPPVTCINLPGTYHCGPCPAGYSGNGWHCVDVDECATDNGGCSRTPFVPCINTRGSMRCGPCPPGYAGNGHTCMWKGRCSTDNGGCHRLARCIETSGVLGVICQCPDGYIGSGTGRRGCKLAPTTAPDPCSTNPCVNGRCRATGSSYTCECDTGFSGSRCQLNTDNCASAPCQHGGTCVDGLNSFRCLCPDTHTGSLCETARQNCGGELTSDTGSIKYPQETGVNYPHSIMCGWKITVSSGKVIQLTFTNFNTESTSGCKFDFLAIHDGRSRGDHKIGQYCGDDLPGGGALNTTHNAAFLYFQSDASIARDGFELTWQAQDPVCGGDLTGKDHGTVSSPGYPGAYPPRYDCVWTITVSPGNKIMFHFATLDLETHSNCTYDYLEIHDGLRETDPLLRRFCSQADPPPLTTMTPYAWLKFHSDSSENGQGFHITYSAIPVKAGNEQCGEALTDSTGVITSPNYPGNYQASITCVWTITVPEGEKIILTFTNMDLEAAARNSDCTMDYVEIREGVDENGALVGTYCGDNIPATRALTTNKVWVKFVTDDASQHTGFRLTWDIACGGSFSDEAGTITSPYYPSFYPHNKVCEYVLVNPTGGQVTIKFDDFTLEQVGDDCEYDYLEVRDGRTTDAGLLHKLCGTETPNPISSNGRALYLRFVSDGSTNNKGFKLNYEMNTQSQTCGGVLTANSGGIQSPGFPNVYPHGISCVWTIDVDPGYIIRLTFHSFSTEKTTNCKYDNVAVYDNSSYTDTGGLLGRYCGSTLPPATTSIENTMTITFQTDSSVAHEGFMATYIALNSSHLCGGQLMTQTGEISSPNYPNNYPHLRECIWTIVIPEGHQIMLNVTDFQMEQHTVCKYDFLEIRNGGYPSSPLMGQFCGTAIPQTFVSQSNRMFLKFKTDKSDSSKGFKIFYDGRASGCGADLTSPSGSFISPNFPLPYGHHAECFWTITVSEGSTVMLLFAEFDLEHGTNCNYDYLEIRDRDRNGQVLGKLCSSVIPQPVNSKTNRIWVKFKTDYSSHGRGFHAVYHSNCEVTLTSVSGVIESPNFPELYPGKRSCAWKIQSTKGNTLNVSFSHFDLEQQSPCTSDYLQVYDGGDTDSNSLGKYCGNQLPPNFASSSRYLLIKFVSDYSIAGTGFRLEWLTNGCGANLKGRTGTFKTPNYPNPSPTYKECIWTIEVEPGRRVELTFQDMDIESTGDCRSDNVEVFGGPDQFAPSLTKLCHTSRTAQKVMSTGNYMYIRFLVEGGNTGKGFNASYKAIVGGCGGNYTTKSGSLVSPNYPGNYPHSTDCSWLITVEKRANIELVVEDFAMEITTSGICQYDYVAFYDGPDQNSRLVQKLCGKNISENASVITHGNQLYIRMRSDSSVTDKGFKAVYTTGCGGMRDATTDGEITSPNYPEAYSENKNCTWVIQSPQSGDRVTLTFTYMDIKKSEDCTSDHVQVHEGDDEYSPLIGSYCGQRIPPSFTSRGSSLTVVFFSDSTFGRSTRGHGFRAVYTSATGACGGDLTSQHGAFVSPEYGVNYPLNRECVWTIGGPPGSKVQISARDFSIPSTANCDNDFLDVRDGGEASRKRWRFCGTDIPANMSFTNNKLWVRFRSSGSIPSGQRFTGFYFYYSLVYGGDVTGESGKIASPNYPKLYPNKIDIEWIITVAVSKRIRIVFEYIDMESNTQCSYDHLTFRDGGTSDDLTISTICGFEKPAPFLSTGNQLNIKFHSDRSREGHGFLFRWAATDEGTVRTTASPGTNMNVTCGETLIVSDRVQNLTSTNFPVPYANRINCVWKLEAPAGSKVWVNVTRVGIEGGLPSCLYDKLEFYDGDGLESPKLTTLCGRQITGDAVISTSTVMTVRFYTDVGLTGIGFKADVRTACGGLMTSPVGVIKSPGFPNAYGPNQNCTWKFQVTNGRKLALSFSNFNIRSTTGCSEDYLQLTDGAFANSPPLGNGTNGRYCGSTTPKLPEQSSSNTLIVTFISSPTSSGSPGFSFTYREVMITCGGRLTLTNDVQSGEFMSHGYPVAYPANIDCIWIITAPSRDGVQVDFHDDFDIEKHSECKFDYIELRDGGTENAPVIGRYCGGDSPGTIKSSGNVFYIRFRTDDSIPRKGFKATYKIATCGGTIRGKDGFISSPNFPHTYPSNTVCEWHIYGLTGHYLTLTFTDFRIASSNNCTNDFVEVREYNATGRLFGTYCGLTIPTLGDTSDSYAYIKFKSDSTIGENGFKLKFESGISECGGELVTPSGVISTPNYPGLYPHMRVCTWNIKVQQGRRVTLTFDDFKLEEGVNCFFDHVRVNNGIIGEAPTIAKLCGKETPDVIESSANTMAVIFKTDGSVSNGGFRATYKSDNPARCGGEVAEGLTTGIITSPNFDLGYYNHSELCIWTITNLNLANTSISLTFVDFEMETHWACAFDYLKIVETTNQEDRLVDRLCGNKTYPPIVSPSPKLTLMFRTDQSFSMVGFKLRWKFQACGGLLTADTGSITSPNYPRNYDQNDFCAWEILAPEGYQIKIRFQDINIEEHSKCESDFLKILNGGSATSPPIGIFCGTDTPKDITSQSNQLRLEFHTDHSLAAKGFKLQYSFVSGGCGGVMHSLNGSIVKPSTSGLTPQTECIWDITVPYGFHVRFQFTAMKFDCSKKEEFVEVLDIGKGGLTISTKTFCVRDGDVLPDVYAGKTNKLRVRYRTPNVQSTNTFASNWSVGCGYLLTEDEGIVMSPMHPRSYPGGLDCNYTISVDPQKFILLEFDDDQFGIERAQIATNNSETTLIDDIACKFDFVAIYDGFNETDAKLIGKFCGKKAPQPMSTLANMIVQFKSDATVGDVGFLANYRASECGGVYTDAYGQIKTPQHPVKYHKSANCSWLITVEDNRAIQLKFNTFDIELHRACSFDYVEVFDGNSTVAPSLGRFCGNVVPDSLRTTGNQMLVNFKSDHSIQLGGFTAAYQTTFGIQQGCGGTLNGATGRISSIDIDYDGRYESNQDCIWQIMADAGKVIKLSFSVFATEGPMAGICRYDFVEIRDGYTFESPLAGRFCGDQAPQPFTSSSNRLYLRFKSDNSDNAQGFNATWEQEDAQCGGYFNLTKAGRFNISSPNYPQPYPHGLRCRWILEAPVGKHIMVNMTDYNIKCGYAQTLEVRDMPLGTHGKNIYFCRPETPRIFYSLNNTIEVDLSTDQTSTGKGFYLTYEIITCNRTYVDDNGHIYSPGWPAEYDRSANCTMFIQAPPGHKISIFFNTFAVEMHSKCRYDFLAFEDPAISDNTTLLQKYCGHLLPDPLFTDLNRLRLRFQSDSSLSGAGFDINYITSPTTGCGGNLTSSNGSFTSPGYPGNQTDASDCVWLLHAPVNTRDRGRLELTFLDFNMGGSQGTCGDNYIEVKNGLSGAGAILAKYCGMEKPSKLLLRNDGYIRYKTDGKTEGTGFRLAFQYSNERSSP